MFSNIRFEVNIHTFYHANTHRFQQCKLGLHFYNLKYRIKRKKQTVTKEKGGQPKLPTVVVFVVIEIERTS